MKHTLFAWSVLVMGAALLGGCTLLPEWVGSEEEKKLEGKRYTILPERQMLRPSGLLKDKAITIPAARPNGAWYQEQAIAEDGFSIIRHALLKGDIRKEQVYSSASAPAEHVLLTANPLVIGAIGVMLDGAGELRAFALDDPEKTLWAFDLNRLAVRGRSASGKEAGWGSWFAEKEEFLGGNIGFVEGLVIATTDNGHVFAFEVESGKLRWHRAMQIAIQSPPSGRNGAVYFITGENQLYALSLKNGETLWTHSGVPQQTKILGAPAPLVLSELVLAPYSSGEIVALKQVNGLKVWEENISASALNTPGFRFSDFIAAPVAIAGRLFASSEGQLVALDVMTGERYWQLPVTLASTPWASGEWLFGITQDAELVAIHGGEGAIKWVTPLPQYVDEKEKKQRIRWSGPVLAGGTLFVVGSHGQLQRFDFADGRELGQQEVQEGVLLPPVLAAGKMLLLNNAADLSILE